MSLRRWVSLALLGAAPIALAGCGYSLRGNLPAHIRTVGVPTFINRTQEPGVENIITSAIVGAFATDGRLTVVRPEEADAILEGEVIRYLLQPIAFRQVTSETTVSEYRLLVTLNLKLRDVRRNAILLDERALQEKADFRSQTVTRDQSAEDGALRVAARDIARSVVSLAVTRF